MRNRLLVLTELHAPEIEAWKADVEAHPRLCGYYILGLVSIRELRAAGADEETILEQVIDHYDDDPSEPDPDFVPDHGWVDNETTRARAREHVVESLVGGGQIGHLEQTMSAARAGELFDRLVALCGPSPRFYAGLGIGNPEYVYLYGVLVVTAEIAGILWVVEDD